MRRCGLDDTWIVCLISCFRSCGMSFCSTALSGLYPCSLQLQQHLMTKQSRPLEEWEVGERLQIQCLLAVPESLAWKKQVWKHRLNAMSHVCNSFSHNSWTHSFKTKNMSIPCVRCPWFLSKAWTVCTVLWRQAAYSKITKLAAILIIAAVNIQNMQTSATISVRGISICAYMRALATPREVNETQLCCSSATFKINKSGLRLLLHGQCLDKQGALYMLAKSQF